MTLAEVLVIDESMFAHVMEKRAGKGRTRLVYLLVRGQYPWDCGHLLVHCSCILMVASHHLELKQHLAALVSV